MTGQPGVVADGPVCHGLCRAQPAPSRPAAKRYVGRRIMARTRSSLYVQIIDPCRGGFIALEMIHDTVRTSRKEDLEGYFRS
jgi:hypothetical protein